MQPRDRLKKATIFERALEKVSWDAGGKPERQPSTFRLCGELIPLHDLALLFPGKLTEKEGATSADLAIELIDALNMYSSSRKEETLRNIRERMEVEREQRVRMDTPDSGLICV